jgi:hypothetical protein
VSKIFLVAIASVIVATSMYVGFVVRPNIIQRHQYNNCVRQTGSQIIKKTPGSCIEYVCSTYTKIVLNNKGEGVCAPLSSVKSIWLP